jgi:HSP20 family protein
MIPIDTAATLDQLSKVKSDNFNAWHCNHTPQIRYFMFPLYMTTSEKSNLIRQEANPLVPVGRYLDNMFEDFRRKMDSMFNLWPFSMTGWLFPLLVDINRRIRLPLCDMLDRGDKYELQLEIPRIDKDKIDVKATKNSVETIGEQSEKSEEKKKNYVYNERSFRSFHRRIPIPEEIMPSKIDAKMNNGILQISLSKKIPTKPEEQTTKVEIK